MHRLTLLILAVSIAASTAGASPGIVDALAPEAVAAGTYRMDSSPEAGCNDEVGGAAMTYRLHPDGRYVLALNSAGFEVSLSCPTPELPGGIFTFTHDIRHTGATSAIWISGACGYATWTFPPFPTTGEWKPRYDHDPPATCTRYDFVHGVWTMVVT